MNMSIMIMMIGGILLKSCGTMKREEIVILLFFICIMSIIYIHAHYPITSIIHPWLLMRLGPSLDHLAFIFPHGPLFLEGFGQLASILLPFF